MAPALHLYLFLLCLSCVLHGYSAQKIASNGNWNAASTWAPFGSPSNGDTVNIPPGVSVSVNCNCGVYSDMQINVEGSLHFPGGRKIRLSSNGSFNVYTGGVVSGSNNGDKLVIDGSAVWTGSMPNIEGPVTCGPDGCLPNAVLPITLISFLVKEQGGMQFLEWKTASETNCDVFTLEKSYDGFQWDFYSELACSIRSNDVKTYEVPIDAGPKECYYRLSQTDIDGTLVYLDILSVNARQGEDKNGLEVFPVPASAWVQLRDDFPFRSVIIYDQYGRLLHEYRVAEDPLELSLDISSLLPGHYVLSAISASGLMQTRRLIVQR